MCKGHRSLSRKGARCPLLFRFRGEIGQVVRNYQHTRNRRITLTSALGQVVPSRTMGTISEQPEESEWHARFNFPDSSL